MAIIGGEIGESTRGSWNGSPRPRRTSRWLVDAKIWRIIDAWPRWSPDGKQNLPAVWRKARVSVQS